VIATATFACTALLSFGWSEQRGVSLSIESADARVGRPLTPVSVAGVARRQYRRGAYGYGYGAGVVGAGLAAGAYGTAAVAATSPVTMGVMVGLVAMAIRLVPGVTMHVNLVTSMAAALTQTRVGILVRVTKAALGTAIDCAVPNGVGRASDSLVGGVA
jgi:hypothetical protein